MGKEDNYALVRLPSGEMRKVPVNCMATIGQVGNIDHENVNIGPAQGGEELRMVEEDSFYGSEMAVGRSYHKLGEVTLQMDENFVLTDDSDPDTPPQVYTAEELFAIRDRLIGEFKPYNTAVTVKNEKIISIYRKFMP